MSQNDGQWTEARAAAWWAKQPWLVGCNFTPSTASNQLEMWQAETFDLETIDRELGWAAGLGFNIIRVYLHDLLWEQDAEGFLGRIATMLGTAARHGIGTMLVAFDDVWCVESTLGPQPEPHPGRHNSRWLQSPGKSQLEAYPHDAALRVRLEGYVQGVISRFAQDPRVLVWDLYNEPGGHPSPLEDPMGERCLPLLRDVFDWARACSPSQPLTSGVWSNPLKPVPESIAELQLERSDIVTFHHYGPRDELETEIDRLRARTTRPLMCTEYLARNMKSRFETHLPIFRARNIGAINWGLVSGRTQTIYPWWSWLDDDPKPEPDVWFHDIFRDDGTPFSEDEVVFIRETLGRRTDG